MPLTGSAAGRAAPYQQEKNLYERQFVASQSFGPEIRAVFSRCRACRLSISGCRTRREALPLMSRGAGGGGSAADGFMPNLDNLAFNIDASPLMSTLKEIVRGVQAQNAVRCLCVC